MLTLGIILGALFGVFALVWTYKSLWVVGPAEVGIPVLFGKPLPWSCLSGLVFLPWVPFAWKLVRIPTKMYRLTYEGAEEAQVMSRDHQVLRVEVSVYLRFPYVCPAYMVRLVKAGVPLTEAGLRVWAEEEILSVVRDVMARYGYKMAIGRDKLDEINVAVNALFDQKDGLLCKTGVCGENPANKAEGSGEVFLKIEQILPTPRLQVQLETIETAELGVRVAKSVAQQEAAEVGAIDLKMDEWIKKEAKRLNKPIEEVTVAAKADGSWDRQQRVYKDFLFAKSGNLDVNRIEIGATDGSPINGNLPPMAALAALFGRVGGQGPKGSNKPDSDKPFSAMTEDEKKEWFEKNKKKEKGNY
jgi:hypothetical protein